MSAPAAVATAPGLVRQLAALLRMEVVLLLRNRTAFVMAVLFPLFVGYLRSGDVVGVAEADVMTIAGTLAVIAVLAVHHHLTTVYASRRQEFVLKRLRAGLPSDLTILVGAASCTVLLFVAQAALVVAYALVALELPAPANPLTIVLALFLVAGIMAAFSAALSAVTRSSEAAMLTTLPTMVLFLATPGVLVSFGELPRAVEEAAWFLPLGPFPDLVGDSWLGRDASGEQLTFLATFIDALPALAVMAGWLLLASLAARRVFVWQPRRA